MRFISKLSVFIFIIAFMSSFAVKRVHAKEKCKRPNWQVVYNLKLNCIMYYNHFILFETSIIKPEIVRKNGYCKVISGSWHVKTYGGKVFIYTAKDLHIDHILPHHYIVKQVGCEKANKYFNVRYNLEPLEAGKKKKKSDLVCLDKEECEKQKNICKKMEQDFGENLHCDNLIFKK